MKKIIPIVVLLTIACQERQPINQSATSDVPDWSRSMIWYQIFPERFRNGDPTNDPRKVDMMMTFPEVMPDSWSVSSWSSDWYKEGSWMAELQGMDFNNKAQLRRYGGDLQGVLDKLDYIEDLGVTGVYFNPLNDAPSLHKYDPRHWRHIDRNFGPDPAGDVELINSENPIDPSTWNWTAADKLFLKVINELHKRNIRVIMDFSWNHTGYDFWAVNDIRKKGEASDFTEWYDIEKFDDPDTKEDETKIKGWWGFKYLPLIKENVENEEARLPHEGNVVSASLKQHIFNVSKRWLDPNDDGDFSDGVDGFRMDVASEMTMGWWRDYRQYVKSVNPEALLVAEAWWFDWPDLTGPEKMVQGDQFDALMNYRWFVLSCGLFKQANPRLTPTEFITWYDSLAGKIPVESQQAMMNIVATHDTPRISTTLFNKNRFDQGSKLADNPEYKVHRPDDATWDLLRMYLLHQFSFVGSPHIWNGDELGMWGANDPDERKPIWWDDIEFEDEIEQPYGIRPVPADIVKPDMDLRSYYQQLITIRKQNTVLSLGDLEYLFKEDDRLVFGYRRGLRDQEAVAVFNLSEESMSVLVEATGSYINALSGEIFRSDDGMLQLTLEEKSGVLLIKQ